MSFGKRKPHQSPRPLKAKKQSYNVQADPDLVQEAKLLVDLAAAVRLLIEDIVKKRVCPCCGTKLDKAPK